MKTTNYLLRFAKMNTAEQILTLNRIDMNEIQAKEFLEKLKNELITQETLLHQTKRKQDITDAKLIENLQHIRVKNTPAKQETEKQRFLRLIFFDIKKLIDEGRNWTEISKYIRTNHHKKICRTTIMRTFKKLEQTLNI